MALNRLTARRVQTAPPGRHEDGGGLRLVVSDSGARRWVFRFSLNGRRREMGLGSFPSISLSAARTEAAQRRLQVSQGIDPILARKREREALRAAQTAVPTFERAVAAFIKNHRRSWTTAHTRALISLARRHAVPKIGKHQINEITAEDVLAVVGPLWQKQPIVAKRLLNLIERVFDYSYAKGDHTGENPARWRGRFDHLLPAPSKVAQTQHRPAIDYREAPALYRSLCEQKSTSAQALLWQMLTATRPGEAIAAEWSEIDLEARIWVIPADKMKTRREHRVPLSQQAIDLLNRLPRIAGNPYIFASPVKPRGHVGNTSIRTAMRKAVNYGVPHGLRSSFRDWTAEQTHTPHAVAEGCLAHVVGNAVERSYRRSDLLEQRRQLMEAWGRYLAEQEAKIIHLPTSTPR
ncbi:integrase arm-type DNA-binding domain-containing protein [Granulosicoccaceae sp. 1_MG-2023]|nr:integrase arm-type DNA-binding domain-containing protein [Granulosicoccaceae sp. 1_MG-2023]